MPGKSRGGLGARSSQLLEAWPTARTNHENSSFMTVPPRATRWYQFLPVCGIKFATVIKSDQVRGESTTCNEAEAIERPGIVRIANGSELEALPIIDLCCCLAHPFAPLNHRLVAKKEGLVG